MMEYQIADWLTNEFLTQCLQKEEGKQHVVVTNFYVSPALPPGNNYSSCISRIKVHYKESEDGSELYTLHLIMKSEHTDIAMKDMASALQVDEPIFYNELLPEIIKPTNITFAPKFYFSPKSSVLILEDLTTKGYIMADKVKQLDFQHCRLYVVAAAWLHATSFAVHKENPELVESIGREKLFLKAADSGYPAAFKIVVANGLKYLADSVEKLDKFSKYSKIIRDISGILWDVLAEVHKPSDALNTLTQGDPHTSNMMFKYDDYGNVNQIKLLDFQALRYGSPVNDLVFFIWTSANHEVRRNRLDELYHIYIDTFNNILKDLNCTERLTYQSFKNSVKKLNPLKLFIVGTFLPIFYSTIPAAIEMFYQYEDQSKGIENPYKIYYNDIFCNVHLPKLLEQLESEDVFDFFEKYKK